MPRYKTEKGEDVDLDVSAPSPQKDKKQTRANEETREVVVAELPQVVTRQATGEDGKKYHLITSTEAIQEILEIVRELSKEYIKK